MGARGTAIAIDRSDWWIPSSIVAALVVGAVLGAILAPSGGSAARRRLRRALTTPIRERSPGFFFLWSGVYLVVLLAVPIAYARNVGHIRDSIADPIAGVLPIGVPLAGAIGAVTIGLYGIFQYNSPRKWDPSFAYWHLARPVMGAVLGAFGFFIFIGVIQASGAEPNIAGTTDELTEERTFAEDDDDGEDDGDRDQQSEADRQEGLIVYYVVAFVVGFREESFRNLVKQAADLLFRSQGDEDAAATEASAIEATGPPVATDDELDGTGVDYTADPVADDDLPTVVLAPDGDPEKLAAYRALFEETT